MVTFKKNHVFLRYIIKYILTFISVKLFKFNSFDENSTQLLYLYRYKTKSSSIYTFCILMHVKTIFILNQYYFQFYLFIYYTKINYFDRS